MSQTTTPGYRSARPPVDPLVSTLTADPALLSALRLETRRLLSERAIELYEPYPKQLAFHAFGKTHRERLLLAANQTGKTFAASAELSFHLTGLYPPWWQGRVFTDPIAAWAIGVSSELTRDSCQRLLFGRAAQPGTGLVPKRLIVGTTASRSASEAYDTVTVRHVSGGNSTVGFKSYQQDREKLQAETLDIVWMDEEPPYPIFSECVTRTNASGGSVMMTFTPLEGMSEVVRLFYPRPSTQDRVLVQMTIDDAAHFSPEQRKRIVSFYKPHEREARTRGIPQLGSGKVFAIPEDAFTCEAFQIPNHWPRLLGIDLGYDHPFGAVSISHDRDADCVYVTHALSVTEHTVAQHAQILKAWGPNTPVAWPHDAASHDRTSGEPIAELYRKQGLRMLWEHATFPEGGFGLEASIADLTDRFESGRLRIFSHLNDLLEELRNYHRKDGRPVKQHDDVISALRYALMMLRFARVPGLTNGGPVRRKLRIV
jgi:phage terminase large subunit-like protein